MDRKHSKKLTGCFATVLLGILMTWCLYQKNDGFALYKIHSALTSSKQWECPTPDSALTSILDQPFYYLAKGAQSYVFASEDGQTVIKFFRIDHLKPRFWLNLLTLPPGLQPYRLAKMWKKREELETLFTSCQIAFCHLKEETGLVYAHLNKTSHLKKQLTIYDRMGISHSLDLDQIEFLVQKRAAPVYPTIEHLMKTGGEKEAKETLSALVALLVHRATLGIADKDPDLMTNFGFLDKRPIQIDTGRFRLYSLSLTPEEKRDELLRITDNMRKWLQISYPSLSIHLLSEIGKIMEGEG